MIFPLYHSVTINATTTFRQSLPKDNIWLPLEGWRALLKLITTTRYCKQFKCSSADKQMNKMWYSNTIEYYLFNNQKKWTTDIYCNIDKPLKNYTKWKRSDTKDHLLCDSIYIKCPKKQIYGDSRLVVAGGGMTANGHGDLLGMMEISQNWIVVMIVNHKCTKNNWIIHLK